MFDPEEAARLILDKKEPADKPAAPSGREAFAAAMRAWQDGDEETAYDAFRAAVTGIDTDDESYEGK